MRVRHAAGMTLLVGALAGALAGAILDPPMAPPGTVVLCRLQGPAPPGSSLAGFQQEAGFYLSGDGAVALLAVPLDARPGPRELRLRLGRIERSLRFEVAADPYPRRLVPPIRGLQSKLEQARMAGDREALIAARRLSQGPPAWTAPFRWPLEPPVVMTSPFGSLRRYNEGQVGWRHRGVDLRAVVGTPVLAPAPGRVLLARTGMAATGGSLVLGHGHGVTTSYYHLEALEVSEGQSVATGQALGRSGATGLASGPHLHWQVELHGRAVDPLQWLEGGLMERALPRPGADGHG